MSYKPPPKGTYGDADFMSEDNWSSQTTAPEEHSMYPPPPPLQAQAIQTPFNQLPNTRFNTPQMQGMRPQDPMAQPIPDFANMASSMTQEDIMFMRKFRRDLFIYRIIPITSVGFGSLYWYNKAKGLPNSFGRFLLVGVGSFFVSISSFRSDFKKLVEESRLNTPYMQAIRRTMNIQPLEDISSGDYGMEYGNKFADGTSNWNATELTGGQRYPAKMDNYAPSQDAASFGPDIGASKQSTSYEELRARNRGYIK